MVFFLEPPENPFRGKQEYRVFPPFPSLPLCWYHCWHWWMVKQVEGPVLLKTNPLCYIPRLVFRTVVQSGSELEPSCGTAFHGNRRLDELIYLAPCILTSWKPPAINTLPHFWEAALFSCIISLVCWWGSCIAMAHGWECKSMQAQHHGGIDSTSPSLASGLNSAMGLLSGLRQSL